MNIYIIKVPANEDLMEDAKELRDLYGVSSVAEAVRRAIACQLLLQRARRNASVIEIQGRKLDGDRVQAIM